MSRPVRHILITGANGFIGRRLTEALLAEPTLANARLTLTDIDPPARSLASGRTRFVAADLATPANINALAEIRFDLVYHLAGIMGGSAEIDYPLSRRVNVDATLNLLEGLRDDKRPPRVVFASSIAVFGPGLPPLVDDDTCILPQLNYGAQKRMIEIVIEQFSARGWIDGWAVRLPGVVARPDADARFKSAFLNTLFFDYRNGRDFILPVGPESTTWLLSVKRCVEALVHAGLIDIEAPELRRAFTLPALVVEMQALIAALAERFPNSPTMVGYRPDPELEAQFGRQPRLETALGDRLGFRHDGTITALVENVFSETSPSPAHEGDLSS